jgi:hypothetical protein
MARDEGMSIRFHKIGDAEDLACQLIEILESPELQYQMAHQNFTAGVNMTMTTVVSKYLRWFALQRHKGAMSLVKQAPGARGFHNPLTLAESNSSNPGLQPSTPAHRIDENPDFREL